MTIPGALRLWGAVILIASTPAPSAAEASEIRAAYDLAFAGLTIAKADVRMAISGKTYTVRVTYGTSGAARFMGSARGEAAATGIFKTGRLLSTTFRLAHQGRDRTQKIDLAMAEGSVNSIIVEPPIARGAPGTPITGAHLENVTDPLSALFLLAGGGNGQDAFEVCDRTVPIFDGMRRIDIALKKKGTGTANQGPYIGELTACQIQITQIAGQMRDEGRRPARPLGAIEMTFGVVGAHKMYVPVSLSAKVGYMTIEARLTHLFSSDSK